jgi:hypothetical protein
VIIACKLIEVGYRCVTGFLYSFLKTSLNLFSFSFGLHMDVVIAMLAIVSIVIIFIIVVTAITI